MNYYVEGFTLSKWWSFYRPFNSFGAAETAARQCLTLWSCTKARVVNASHSFVVEVAP